MNLIIQENKIAKMIIEISKTTTSPVHEKLEKQKMWHFLVTLQTCIDWNLRNNVNAPQKS